MAETTEYFTVPSLADLGSLESWQLEGGHGRDARYRNVILKFRLTCKEHPTLLRGPVVKEFDLAENDARTFRTSTRRTVLRLEKVQDAFTSAVADKLTESITGETIASGRLGAGKVTSRFSTTLAGELTRSWSTATTREHVVSTEETVETQEESTAAGIPDRLKTVTVYKTVKHLEYELRLVGYQAFEIATKKEGLVLRDIELQAFTHAVPLDARVATTHVYVASGPEQLHTVIRRNEGGAWADDVPPYPAYVADIADTPRVLTEIDPTLAAVVERIFDTDVEIQRALEGALGKAKKDAGAAHKNRAAKKVAPRLPAAGKATTSSGAVRRKKAGKATKR